MESLLDRLAWEETDDVLEDKVSSSSSSDSSSESSAVAGASSSDLSLYGRQ